MPIKPQDLYELLLENGISFFTGVPDSLLKEFCLCVDAGTTRKNHIIAANEGNAIALASGYHLSTGHVPLVYMQNSGLGNAVNPLLSLCDADVFSIPVLLLIGWRGESGVSDEPQHKKQGKVQIELLNALGIPFEIISGSDENIKKPVTAMIDLARREKRPTALVVRKGTFAKYGQPSHHTSEQPMMRERAIEIILSRLDGDCIIVSTTGKTSRELFEQREKRGEPHHNDFLTIGSMGHCSQVALGIALQKSERKVICLDGDGALIMHMGGIATIGMLAPKNFKHILLNNRVHESVGGQETASGHLDFPGIMKMSGYENVYTVQDENQLKDRFDEFLSSAGPSFLEIKIRPGSRDDLGRPSVGPKVLKENFMDSIIEKGGNK